MSRRRINLHDLRSGAAVALATLVLTGGGLPTATAALPLDLSPSFLGGCPVERIGTQLVRCDNLTGAGARAPSWIPESNGWADRRSTSKGCG